MVFNRLLWISGGDETAVESVGDIVARDRLLGGHEVFNSSLNAHEVQMNVKAVGMNMVELSTLTGGYDTNDMSSEFAGVITNVGSGIQDICVGGRVFGLHGGKSGNVLRLPALACQRARCDEFFEQLATLPSAYCTALYAIETVGRLQPGETVLIQSATGGFGTAAITVARLHRAEVHVTAGSESKRQLLQEMGIPASHIRFAQHGDLLGAQYRPPAAVVLTWCLTPHPGTTFAVSRCRWWRPWLDACSCKS